MTGKFISGYRKMKSIFSKLPQDDYPDLFIPGKETCRKLHRQMDTANRTVLNRCTLSLIVSMGILLLVQWIIDVGLKTEELYSGLFWESLFVLLLSLCSGILFRALDALFPNHATLFVYLFDLSILVPTAVLEAFCLSMARAGDDSILFPMFLFALCIGIFDLPQHVCHFSALLSVFYLILTFVLCSRFLFLTALLHLVVANVILVILHRHLASIQMYLLAVGNQARESACHDALTGILNRGGGQERVLSCLKEHESGAFLLMDIDNFKKINDTYGHDAGDQVLQEAAKVLAKVFRSTDIVMRFGGDEFAVYAVSLTDPEITREKLAQILEGVHTIVPGGDASQTVSCCIGCCICDGFSTDFETLYHEADEMLYRVKKDSKDGFLMTSLSSWQKKGKRSSNEDSADLPIPVRREMV